MNPLKTQLHILQLEGYQPFRFLRWWTAHPFTFATSQKKPLVYTFKIKLILLVTFTLFILITYFFIFPLNLLLVLLLAIEPYPLLIASLVFIKPYEIVRRLLTIEGCRNKITNHPHLTVIGITGSYGKTSTKDFLFDILEHTDQTLKTPESFNTVFGISKVIDLELHKKLHYFICEMGAYVRGEIKELTHMVPPQYAILTAIGSQHLERFKKIENTTLAKFELIDSVSPENALANLDNPYINNQLQLSQYQKVKTYSLESKNADFYVSEAKMDQTGMSFLLTHKNKKYKFKTHLFGTANLSNLAAAIGMAFMLGTKPEDIISSVEKIDPSPHRLELKKVGDAILIDNAFSSNEEGFSKMISDLKNLKGKKALITPGIIELGEKTNSVHEKIGKLASEVFDHVYLVGKSDRTTYLEKGLGKKFTINYLENKSSVWPTIDALAKTHDWILLENDLPDNF